MTIKIKYSPVFAEDVTSYKFAEGFIRQTLNDKTVDYDISNLEANSYYYSDDYTVQIRTTDTDVNIELINYIANDASYDDRFPTEFNPEYETLESDEIVSLNKEIVEEINTVSETDKLKAQIAVLESQLGFQSDVMQELAIQIYSRGD